MTFFNHNLFHFFTGESPQATSPRNGSAINQRAKVTPSRNDNQIVAMTWRPDEVVGQQPVMSHIKGSPASRPDSFNQERASDAKPIPGYAKLPAAPQTASPVPHLTSLYHFDMPGGYGDRAYAGNCGGNLIKDLLRFFNPASVIDPMTGSGTCKDVCRELDIHCHSSDLRGAIDACDPANFPTNRFEFAWLHPPYWRQKLYTSDSRDLSRSPTMKAFLVRYRELIATTAGTLMPGSRVAILMGDYMDRDAGFVPLVYHTKRLAFELGLQQRCTDIIRFSHGTSSSRKVYQSSFIPGLHDVCMVFQKPK